MEYIDNVKNIISQHSSVVQQLALIEKDISAACELIIRAIESSHKIAFCGNGGSAADAQHLAAEFTGKFMLDRNPMPAMAFTTNSSVLTAIANDYSFEDVFKRQAQAFLSEGDIFIGISTSGNSKNILSAAQVATSKGAKTIALTGQSGGLMADNFDLSIKVPSTSTARIQEVHILVGHIICEIVESKVFSSKQ